ncbi:MAG: hypothetical protein JXA90_08080, partial [Planctomycetes bacterium]|nr:hypothetical protein [Planctomycetota bacterium]
TAKHYFATLQDAFAEKPAWPAMIQSLLYFTSHLPKAIRLRWQVKTLRLLARPADVLQVLSGLDGISLDEHLRSPPLPLSRQMPVDGTPLSMHQELLRQLLCLADDYALDVVFFLLSGPHLKLAAKHGWSDLFVEIAGLHRSIRSWIARRAREHCHAAAFFALASLPLHCVKDGLMSGFKEGGEDEQLGFVSVFERLKSAVATRMLSVALEFPSVKARQAALEMMGRHDNPYAFKTLLSILKERNKGASNAYEASIICNALALHQGEEGRASLRKIVSDVKSLLGIGWRKDIRQAARMALNEWKSREPESHG